jgi:hypothetical protein
MEANSIWGQTNRDSPTALTRLRSGSAEITSVYEQIDVATYITMLKFAVMKLIISSNIA